MAELQHNDYMTTATNKGFAAGKASEMNKTKKSNDEQ
jgi:hypothetical protein